MAIPDDDDRFEEQYRQNDYEAQPLAPNHGKAAGINEWLLVVTLVLILAVAVVIAFAIHTQRNEQRMASANTQLATQLSKTEERLDVVTNKLNALSTPPPLGLPADETLNGPAAPASTGGVSSRQPRHNTRQRHISLAHSEWRNRMQRQLSAQRARITAAEQAIAKARADMASNADNARSNLNQLGGSIARNHAELVALEQQGQRTYYEFDLFKSKRFEREGPIGLELRHTNTKHGNYDVNLLIDDSKLTKKHVNLYEPLIFETGASPQPIELVVNRIDKNHVHGYVSVPKSYSERASANQTVAAPQLSLTPAPAKVSGETLSAQGQPGSQASPELTLSRQP